jgi:glycosyltransferase involved in cell wall biosynthesis
MRRLTRFPHPPEWIAEPTELFPLACSASFGGRVVTKQVAATLPTVSVVIPYLDEEQNLPVVLDELPASLNEVVLVDGQSRDRSAEVAREHRPDAVFLSQHSAGKGAASIAGLLAATGDIVVLMDADCSMMTSDIDRFVEKLLDGADVVHGSRNLPGGGSSDFTRVRSAGNTALTRIANLLYGVRWSDLTFGYMAMWRDVVSTLRLGRLIDGPAHPLYSPKDGIRNRPNAYGHGFEVEVLILCRAARAGLSIEEVPSFEQKRRQGTSSLNAFRDGLRVANTLFRERIAPVGLFQVEAQYPERIPRLGAAVPNDLLSGQLGETSADPETSSGDLTIGSETPTRVA